MTRVAERLEFLRRSDPRPGLMHVVPSNKSSIFLLELSLDVLERILHGLELFAFRSGC